MTHHPTLAEARAKPGRTLAILTIAALAYSLAQTLVIPALPAIQKDVHTSASSATWLLTAFLVSSSVATPIMGRLGDMYGKERLMLWALGAFGLGSLVAALGNSIEVLILGRVIQGGGGAIFPLSFGIIRDEFPRERVAPSIGLLSSTFGIGGGAGLVLSGIIVDHFAFQWIFWLSIPLTVLAVWATWRFVPESPVRAKARIDYVGGVLMSVALVACLVAVSEGNDWGWTSGRTLGLFAFSAVMFVVWGRYELRVVDPIVDLRVLAARPVLTTNISAFLIGFAMFGAYVLIPQLVQAPKITGYGFGLSATGSGLIMLPSAVVMLWSGPLSGRLGARFGSRLPLAAGCVFACLSYFTLAFVHGARVDIVFESALLGIGIGLAFAAMANLIVEAVRPDQTGVASGINTIMRSIGGAVGAQICAAIVTGSTILDGKYPAESGFTAAFALSGAGALVALFVTFLIPKPAPRGQFAGEAPEPAGTAEPVPLEV